MTQDLFSVATVEPAFSSQKVLRPYQSKAIDLISQSHGQGNRRVVCQGPTGFGKTLLSAKVIQRELDQGGRVIFTAPAVTLIDQTVRAFEEEGIYDIGVMQASHPRTNPYARVQVASVQTLARRRVPQATLVVVDECHIRSAVVERLLNDWQGVRFLGLSATPWAKGMGRLWDDLVIPVTLDELIEDGYLSKFRVFAPDTPDLSKVKTVAGDFHEGQSAQAMSNPRIMAHVVENWLAHGQDRPTLLFGVNCAHAKSLFHEFERAGVSAAYVDAFTDSVERHRIEREFRRGEVKVACSVRTLTTGVDWPVGCIIDAAPTKSDMLHVQKIGRGLRVNPGTEDLVVFDHAGNSLRLGMVTDIRYDELDQTKRGQQQFRPTVKKPRECSKCSAVHTGLVCPSCGHETVIRPKVVTVQGQLVELTGGGAQPSFDEKAAFLAQLFFISDARGYKRGWAAHKFKEKFGAWPPRSMQPAPRPPSGEVQNWVKSRQIAFARSRRGAQR